MLHLHSQANACVIVSHTHTLLSQLHSHSALCGREPLQQAIRLIW